MRLGVVHGVYTRLEDGDLLLQGGNLVFDGVGQAVVIQIDVLFRMAYLFALLEDDAARNADDCRIGRHFF